MEDVKELVGTIMRVLDHAEITEAEVLDIGFEAEGEALAAVNDAYIKLLEFVHDRDLRLVDPDLDTRERALMQDALKKIARLSGIDPR
jgi:hypothetical protein